MPSIKRRILSTIMLSVVLLSLSPTSSALILPANTFPIEGVYSEEGGTTILMEEYTATWCDVCKLTDPALKEISEANEDRIALIALHPLDGTDSVANIASAQRISQTALSESIMTPSFLFDSELEREGALELIDIQSELLEAENNRRSHSKLKLNVSITNTIDISLELNGEYNLSDTVLTIMITENNVKGNSALSLDDVETYDRVLKGLFTANLTIIESSDDSNLVILPEDQHTFAQYWGEQIDPMMSIKRMNGKITLEISFQAPNTWNMGELGIIGVHEKTNIEGNRIISTLGVVQILQFDLNQKEDSSVWIMFMALIFSTGFALAYIDKYTKKKDVGRTNP